MKSSKVTLRLILLMTSLLAVGSGIGFYWQNQPVTARAEESATSAPSMTVTTSTVEEQHMEASLMVSGSVVARDETLIGSEVSGLRIIEITVDEGDWVEEGQLLARLSSKSLEAQLAQSDAAIEKSAASISLQSAALKEAELKQRDAESKKLRGDQLLASKSISNEEHESLQTTALSAALKTESGRHSLTLSQAELLVAQAQRDQVNVQLSQTEIRAPCAGLISKRMAKVGSVVGANSELFRLVANGLVELDAQVAELDLPVIQTGQRVLVRTSSKSSDIVQGTVRSIAPTVDPMSRLGIVHVSLPKNSSIKPGQFVRGEIKVGKYVANVIPDAAILYRETSPYVYVVGENSSVAQRTIEIGQRQQSFAEVKKGLTLGEQVVLQGSGFLKPGDRIRIAEGVIANRDTTTVQRGVQ